MQYTTDMSALQTKNQKNQQLFFPAFFASKHGEKRGVAYEIDD